MTSTPPTPARTPPGNLFCLGLGYTAEALAHRLASRGFAVAGTSRTADGAAAINRDGWQGLAFAGDAPPTEAVMAAIEAATHVLISASPDAAGDPVLRHLGAALGQATSLRWIGYLSTIGVYGGDEGAWVDETTLPRPTSDRNRWRLAAEAQWLQFGAARDRRVEIFRLPGIYGPGRSAIDQLLAGTARRIVKPGQVFNRMHVADIAAALEAAIESEPRQSLYNLTDDEPAPSDVVMTYAAQCLGVTPPPAIAFEDAQLSPMAKSFYGQSKRVSNQRMKAELGVVLRYPTYREGLRALANAARARGVVQTASGRDRGPH